MRRYKITAINRDIGASKPTDWAVVDTKTGKRVATRPTGQDAAKEAARLEALVH